MRFKISILALIFLFFFGYCETPFVPEPPEEPVIPVIEYFKADKSQISLGESSTLSWSTIDAEIVLLSCYDDGQWEPPTIFVVDKTGTREVWPVETTDYRLTAYTKDKYALEFLTVEVVTSPP